MVMQRARDNDIIRTRLATARRLVRELQPFSPAWDAAMAGVDDLEGQVRSQRATSTAGMAEPVGATRAR